MGRSADRTRRPGGTAVAGTRSRASTVNYRGMDAQASINLTLLNNHREEAIGEAEATSLVADGSVPVLDK